MSDRGGGGHFTNYLVWGVQHVMKKMTQRDLRFCEMRGQKDLITMKNGVNKIDNQGGNLYKLLQKCQMTDFWEK